MKKFKESFSLLEKRKLSAPKDQEVVKTFANLGNNKDTKVDAHITKDKKFHYLYVDGIRMDKFKSEKEAEKQLNQFLKVMGV
jgi:hypothetical protein